MNKVQFSLFVFGACSISYAISRLLTYLAVSGDQKQETLSPVQRILFIISGLFWICGFPAGIVFGLIDNLYTRRLVDRTEKELNAKWHSEYLHTPCPHCGRPRFDPPADSAAEDLDM